MNRTTLCIVAGVMTLGVVIALAVVFTGKSSEGFSPDFLVPAKKAPFFRTCQLYDHWKDSTKEGGWYNRKAVAQNKVISRVNRYKNEQEQLAQLEEQADAVLKRISKRDADLRRVRDRLRFTANKLSRDDLMSRMGVINRANNEDQTELRKIRQKMRPHRKRIRRLKSVIGDDLQKYSSDRIAAIERRFEREWQRVMHQKYTDSERCGPQNPRGVGDGAARPGPRPQFQTRPKPAKMDPEKLARLPPGLQAQLKARGLA